MAQVTFSFKNIGSEAIKVLHVQASCGCTTPEWSQNPVAPGETGVIKAAYDPIGRPGSFDKAITVKTDGTPEIVVLKISGNVIPRPKGPQDYYPVEVGSLRFKTTHLAFGQVFNDATDTASTVVYNQGQKPIKLLLDQTKLPAHVSMTVSKAVIEPGKTVTLSFQYNTVQKNDWGYVFDFFTLSTDDASEPGKRMNVSADIREDFSKLPADAAKPKIKFDKITHNFGQVAKNSRVTTTFQITNEGQGTLLIRKTKASCGCTATSPEKTVLAPGESTLINVAFSTGDRAGKQKKSIAIISNDPATSNTNLWIEADVLEESGK